MARAGVVSCGLQIRLNEHQVFLFVLQTSVLQVSASGKPAWTHFQPLLLLSRGTEKYTLLIVVIRTGRTHQIRVHAQHIGARRGDVYLIFA